MVCRELGYGDMRRILGIVGLLHDIDFELYPQEALYQGSELLREGGVCEDIIRSVVSHGYGMPLAQGYN